MIGASFIKELIVNFECIQHNLKFIILEFSLLTFDYCEYVGSWFLRDIDYRRNFSEIRPAGIYLFKVSNGNTRTVCEIFSKLTIKTPD